MDQDTLARIAGNRPTAAAAPTLPHPLPMLVPDAAWFARLEAPDSIHGIRHGARVSLLVHLLAREHRLDDRRTTALAVGAAVHDCQRRNDRADNGHGKRAADWLTRHHSTVTEHLESDLPTDLLEPVATAVALHDVAHSAFTPAQTDAYQRARPLVDLLKAADCLDRYRLPLTRWWPDASQLRVDVPPWLYPLAFDLAVHSEQARLDGATQLEALDHARQRLITG
ncbi:hypothetical protein [Kitasatospora sp. NPDC057015]|uniref:hypothetical protein n=1 Tax=Kitasatospora sp. NPDC057015 TaxID=3346001 RepID=UPI00362A0DC6